MSHLVDVRWRKNASERRVLLILNVVKITLSASFFLGIFSPLSQCWAHLRTAAVAHKGAGMTGEGKSSIFIQTRPAKHRQLQCLLAPYDVLPVYFRNYRRGLDVGMRIYIFMPAQPIWNCQQEQIRMDTDPVPLLWELLREKVCFSYHEQGQGLNQTRGRWVVILWPSIHSVDLTGMSGIELHKKHNYQWYKEW